MQETGRPMDIRVLIADDHMVVLEGLRVLFERWGVDVVGQARTGRQAVEMCRKLSPHVVVTEVGMPELNGVEATRQISSENPGTHVVALSVHNDARSVRQMLQAGAKAYLLKSCDFSELSMAVTKVMEGHRYVSPEIAGVLVDDYIQRTDQEPSTGCAANLTSREVEVLQLLAEGRTAKEIARDLHISDRTVHTHRQRVLDKVGVKSLAELTKWALREGITRL